MAGVPGKNKLERGMRVLFDNSANQQKDLSADLVPGSFSGFGFSSDTVDMTGVSDTVENGLASWLKAPVKAKFYLNDTATTGAYTVLANNVGYVGTLTVQVGSNGAAPSTGDPKFEGEYTLISAPIVNEGGKLALDVTWEPGSATAPAFGTVA